MDLRSINWNINQILTETERNGSSLLRVWTKETETRTNNCNLNVSDRHLMMLIKN